MSEAIAAYRHVAASDKFIQLEKVRSKARHDEAQAIGNAERRGELRGAEQERAKWQAVATELEELRARLAELEAQK